jgi:hypothetical protein
MTLIGSVLSTSDIAVPLQSSPTPGATVSVVLANGTLFSWTAGENETVNVTLTGGVVGASYFFKITNDGVVPRTITMGTNITSSGAIVGTVSKIAVVHFVYDGSRLIEASRTLGL